MYEMNPNHNFIIYENKLFIFGLKMGGIFWLHDKTSQDKKSQEQNIAG